MKPRVLIIEDTVELAELYAMYLEREGMECSLSPDAETALPLVRSASWDLVVLDINLPGIDGFEFLRRFREHSEDPVMILTAREADEDVIRGLGLGADDFITKPCPPKVFAARAGARIRRSSGGRPLDAGRREVLRFGDFEYDSDAFYLKSKGEAVTLSSRETGVLDTLVKAAGRPLSPQELYDSVWGREFGDIGAVGIYIQRLRRKLGEDPREPRFIQTVHGLGYRFNPEFFKREGS